MSTELIKKATLAEIDGHRTAALEHYRQAAEHILAGNKIADLACPAGQHGFKFSLSRNETDQLAYSRACSGDFVDAARETLDQAIWRHVLRATTLADVLDAKARKDLEESLAKDCPPANFETMAATLQALVGNSPLMIKRGVVELFRRLSKNHRTNDAFRIGDKLILESLFSAVSGGSSWQNWNHGSMKRDSLVDLERTLHVIDGQRPPEHDCNIVAKVDAGRKERQAEREIETDYLRMRWFQNGNAHVWIKRPDLVTAVNRVIAEYCGEVLPHARNAA